MNKAEQLAWKTAQGRNTSNVPLALQGNPEAIVIYNNLPDIMAKGTVSGVAESEAPYGNEYVDLALEIDRVMRKKAPAGWRGDDTRENQVLNALFPVMERDREATKALFELIKNMRSYT